MKKIIFLFAAILAIAACEETSPIIQDAVKVSESELETMPGYEWFGIEKEFYKPNDSLIARIAAAFDSTADRFVLFIKPACSCGPVDKISADFLKTIETAGIDSSYYEIYSMSDVSAKNPYETALKLNRLPSIFLFVGGTPVYSITDTFAYFDAIARTKLVEEITLDALERY